MCFNLKLFGLQLTNISLCIHRTSIVRCEHAFKLLCTDLIDSFLLSINLRANAVHRNIASFTALIIKLIVVFFGQTLRARVDELFVIEGDLTTKIFSFF